MNATERVRELLNERGVEWMDSSPIPSMKPWKTSYVSFTGEEITLSCYDEPKWIMGTMVFLTPEQAVAATLGDAPRLPYWWTHDGTLHIEATRMPTRIVVCEGGTCEFVPKRELDASEAENAKLRELVRIAVKHCDSGTCDGCPIQGESGSCPYSDMARELGVEVDG